MKTYKIEIKETLSKVVDINAKSESEAIKKAKDLYYFHEDIELSYEDLKQTEIICIGNIEVEK